jgi:hypothetical protein
MLVGGKGDDRMILAGNGSFDLIRSPSCFYSNHSLSMPIDLADLETAIRNAIPVVHLEIEDQSSGCGQNYAIILVSEVSGAFYVLFMWS